MAGDTSLTSPPLTVAVQGELGSNSELAAREYFDGSEVTIVPCRTFAALFDAVHSETAEFGMAPVDNSMGGSIHEVWELLVDTPLPIEGEIFLRISHCLISHRGTRLTDIRRIYSHPQALAQCREYLSSQQDVDVEEVYDTAGAVKMIAERRERETPPPSPLRRLPPTMAWKSSPATSRSDRTTSPAFSCSRQKSESTARKP